MARPKPGRKARRRERRAAARHGLTVDRYRTVRGLDRGERGPDDPVQLWADWRAEATEGADRG